MCLAEPTCQLFVADSLCCMNYGIVQQAAVRLWLVCNADVYLPEPKCLTELLVDLPIAYYVPPVSRRPGEMSVQLDFEQTRMTFEDGLCSLRLRTPCEWEGAVYQSVIAVQPLPLLSVLGANATADAAQLVADQLFGAARVAVQQPGAVQQDKVVPHVQPALPAAQRRLQAAAGSLRGRGRALRQVLLSGDGGGGLDPLLPAGTVPDLIPGTESEGQAGDFASLFEAPNSNQRDTAGARSSRMLVTVVGAELPVPVVDEALLPSPTDVLGGVQGLQADLLADDYFISWIPSNATAGELCAMTNAGDLPESFLLGNLEDLVGYEEDCTPNTLLELSPEQ
ncbi:hypothetical protein D9Q98_008081 [Chlorella vulgaris]|uniref:Uncharacterized protein n=1 Tax=Chlorella vulgaris TaxID=3077 RepID=A0A9D4TFW4_CHLVU|nr:hypothetical protein D9Q98_008081 [Chlorella vulgaris]